MKKISVLLLCVMVMTAMLAVSSFAGATSNTSFDIPKAAVSPVIDAEMTGDEWNGALVRKLNADNMDEITNAGIPMTEASFYFMWDDAGLYFFADVINDTSFNEQPAAGQGSYNSGNGVQLCIYASSDLEGSVPGSMFFFSLCPFANDGNPYIGDHHTYSDGNSGVDVTEAVIASAETNDGYTIECFIPAEVFAKTNPAIEIKEGTVLPMANIVMFREDGAQALFCDTAWFSAVNSNKYTLAASEVPTVDDTPAEDQPSAPQTADIISVAALIAVSAFGAAAVVSKKK